MGEDLAIDIPHSIPHRVGLPIVAVSRDLLPTYQTAGPVAVKYPPPGHSGDDIGKVLPVPIPNTEVKLSEPMIVHTSVKVGIAGF